MGELGSNTERISTYLPERIQSSPIGLSLIRFRSKGGESVVSLPVRRRLVSLIVVAILALTLVVGLKTGTLARAVDGLALLATPMPPVKGLPVEKKVSWARGPTATVWPRIPSC